MILYLIAIFFIYPVRRSSLLLKLALVALHLVFIGFLFLFDAEFIEKTKRDPWLLLLISLCLFNYCILELNVDYSVILSLIGIWAVISYCFLQRFCSIL